MTGKIPKESIAKIIFAYEPDWAISTNEGLFCSPDDALTMALFIRKLFSEIYGRKTGQEIKVLYGGSVSSSNASSYLENLAIDGLLVGGASLNIKEFVGMVKNI
jgi:triosephosphate isomerase